MFKNNEIILKSEKAIVNLAEKTINKLHISEKLKEEIIELEIQRIKSENLYTGYRLDKGNIMVIESDNFIVYNRKINDKGCLKILLNNSKIDSIEVIYKSIISFNVFGFSLLLNDKPKSSINEQIKYIEAKLAEFKIFCQEIENIYYK